MPIKTQIQLSHITSMDELYRQLAEQVELPSYFGRNLDALYDVLTGYLDGPIELVWRDFSTSQAELGTENHTALLTLLNDATTERDDFKIKIS